jgi:hypothetical protein
MLLRVAQIRKLQTVALPMAVCNKSEKAAVEAAASRSAVILKFPTADQGARVPSSFRLSTESAPFVA